MKKYKDYIIIIIILILILVSIIGINVLNGKDNKNTQEKITFKLEDSYDKFFTIDSCVNKYIEFLTKKDVSSLLEVLNKKYIENNNITQNNLFNYIDNLDGIYSFTSKEIYTSNSNDIYYIYGFLNKENIDGIESKTKKFYLINVDEENSTFDIQPIKESRFLEVKNE